MARFAKAKMFNKKASKQKSKPQEVFESLKITPGQTIADIGSGGGFFSLLFADAVGLSGKVYAIDINTEFLEYLQLEAQKRGLRNIETVQAAKDHIPLPKASVDLVFVRNVYHHLINRVTYFSRLSELLRPQARVCIIEYRRHGSPLNFHRLLGHHVPLETIVSEMQQAGYQVLASYEFLPVQSFTVFMRKI